MIEPRYSDFFDKPQIIYPKGLKKLFDVHYWPLAYSRIEMFIYLHYVAKGAINIEPFISGDQRYILGEDYLPYGISKNEYGDEFRDVNQTRIDLIELWRKLDPNGECLEWEKAYNPSFFDSNWPILDNGLEKSEIEDMSNLFISFLNSPLNSKVESFIWREVTGSLFGGVFDFVLDNEVLLDIKCSKSKTVSLKTWNQLLRYAISIRNNHTYQKLGVKIRKVATYNPIYNFYWEYDISKKDFEEKEIQFLKEFEKFTKYYQNKRQKEN